MKILGMLILFMAGLAVPVEYIQFFWIGGFVITPAKVATGLLVVWVLFLILTGTGFPSKGMPIKHVVVLLYGFSALIGLMVSLLSGLPISNLLAVASTWLFLVIFYFTLGRSLLSRQDADAFLAGVAVGGVFVSVTGLLGVGFQTFSEQGERIGGFGGNSNELAMNLLIAISIAGYFITGSTGRVRAFWVMAMPVLIFGLISTLSRSGILALVIMGAFWMFRFRRFDTLKFAIPAVVIAIGLFALSPDALVERLETMQPDKIGSDTSIQSRLKSYPYALQALASNPVIGVGMLGSLPYIYEASGGTSGTNTVHNMFLQIGAEFGLLGLLPLIALVWLTWRDFTRCWFASRSANGWRDSELRRLGLLAAFLQIAFLGTLILGQFQPTHNQRGLWLLYAITPALVRLLVTRHNEVTAARDVQAPPDDSAMMELGASPVRGA